MTKKIYYWRVGDSSIGVSSSLGPDDDTPRFAAPHVAQCALCALGGPHTEAAHDAQLGDLTIAVRVCSDCKVLLGVMRWEGADAHKGEDHVITHGLCDKCLEEQG